MANEKIKNRLIEIDYLIGVDMGDLVFKIEEMSKSNDIEVWRIVGEIEKFLEEYERDIKSPSINAFDIKKR